MSQIKNYWMRRVSLCAVFAIIGMFLNHPAHADEVWQTFGAGMNSDVLAVIEYNGDLIAGGHFATAGGQQVNFIARWDGEAWNPLVSGGEIGVNSSVYALAIYNGDLIVGGDFWEAGGQIVNSIARWDGSTWHPFTSGGQIGLGGGVSSLTVWNGNLVAGGWFTNAGGQQANQVARWDGSAWHDFIVDEQTDPAFGQVNALTVYNGELIAGGVWDSARWDGTAWHSFINNKGGNFWGGEVLAMTVWNGKLIAGGWFGIAQWDGIAWSEVGGGVGGVFPSVHSFSTYNGTLIAGGDFGAAGGVSARNIASYNGQQWLPFGSGMTGAVRALGAFDGRLVAGGSFGTAGGQSVNYIAATSAVAAAQCTTWHPLGEGISGEDSFFTSVRALIDYQDDLIAAGWFDSAGGQPASNIARWDGDQWSPLGNGLAHTPGLFFPTVFTLTEYAGSLIAGGNFYTAKKQVINLARWDGNSWLPLVSSNGYSIYGDAVHAAIVWNGELIVGGEFLHVYDEKGEAVSSGVARWDGLDWHVLGAGIEMGFSERVHALAVWNGDLYAGGSFTMAGGQQVNGIARWDGSTWHLLGTGVQDSGPSTGTVFALAVWNGNLIAGGMFELAGGQQANNIARWDGTTWHPFTVGKEIGMEFFVRALTVWNGDLIAGGQFLAAGGEPANSIARWDGSAWHAVGSGVEEVQAGKQSITVHALTVHQGALVTGGEFQVAGGQLALNIARWGVNTWLSPISGQFAGALSWELPFVEDVPAIFGITSGALPFDVTFQTAEESLALCIVNQRPVFNLNRSTYEVREATVIGADQSASLTVNNGTLLSPTVGIGTFGTLSGDGEIVGFVSNDGMIRPGSASTNPGALSLLGAYKQTFGTFESLISPAAHGNLTITGNAEIAGTLKVNLVNGANPQSGNFPLITATGTITGAFDVALLPYLGDDLVMNLEYPGAPVAMSGGEAASGSTDGSDGNDDHTPLAGPGGAINITIGTPNGSPDPDQAQNFGLTGNPTGITGALIQPAATESDLALSIADLDPQNNGDVLVLLNNGGGTSFTPIIVEVGREPSGIAAAALADGAVVDDLAVPNMGDNTISVLFHEGSPIGNYTVVTISAGIGSEPSAIAAGDFNDDGLADLAVTNRGDNSVAVLVNNGDRTFTALTPIAVGGAPVSIAAGDFAGSILDDLVVANSTGNSITLLVNQDILLNIASGLNSLVGEFDPQTIPVGPKPIIVNPTDVDNDRDLDLIVSLEDGGSVALVRNLGGGVLSSPVTMPMDGAPSSMDAWDMDKDGDDDIVVVVDDVNLLEPVIRLLRNDSTLTQIAYTVFEPIGQGEMPQLVNGSDVNGDALDDLVSVNVAPAPPLNGPGGTDGPSRRDPSMSIRKMLFGTEPLCRADVAPSGNLDGNVGVPDLLFIINAWGPCVNPNNCPADIAPEGPPPGNVIGDDIVGVPDLLYIINHWGPCS